MGSEVWQGKREVSEGDVGDEPGEISYFTRQPVPLPPSVTTCYILETSGFRPDFFPLFGPGERSSHQ